MEIRFKKLEQIKWPGIELVSTQDPRIFKTQVLFQYGAEKGVYHLVTGVDNQTVYPYYHTTVFVGKDEQAGFDIMSAACLHMQETGEWPQ